MRSDRVKVIERQTRFAECETIIERGLQTFIEVGQALAEIRDQQHYLDEFDTFEVYCKTRWNFTPSRASRLITASEVTTALPIGNGPLPTNEGQARELSGLAPDAAADVMRRADKATIGNITAATIRAARAELEGSAYEHPGINLSGRHIQDPGHFPDWREALMWKLNHLEWFTAWAAWELRRRGHSLDEIAAIGRSECYLPDPPPGAVPSRLGLAESWQALKGTDYASYFIQYTDGGTRMLYGVAESGLAYAYVTEWQQALDDDDVRMMPGEVRVPAEWFSQELAELRIATADRLEFGEASA